ncbi:hypothetical protein [Paenibacillus tepidiphilus]|uniref:hypothetical protein n=1 Tax=Paenibacillus tepidiphilus TaxID=2608683 RepID=UPI00123896B4|nr:hypothetical protein [Paenibacillus tepidiphilus]
MKVMRKTVLLLFTSVMLISGSAYAAEESVDSSPAEVKISNPFTEKVLSAPKTVDVLESSIVFNEGAPTSEKLLRVEKVDLDGIDEVTGKIVDKKALKESLSKSYKSGTNVEGIFNKIIETEATKGSDSLISPMSYYEGQVVLQDWTKGPYLDSQNYMVRYNTTWLSEDNYRSSVPITINYTKTQKVSLTINWTGSDEIKKKFGFTVGGSAEQQTSISQGAAIPAWTVWGTRPYIHYRNDNYSGEYCLTIWAGGALNNYYYTKTGTNTIVISKANEYWSRVNESKNLNATTPTFPTTAPNV